MIIYTLYQ